MVAVLMGSDVAARKDHITKQVNRGIAS